MKIVLRNVSNKAATKCTECPQANILSFCSYYFHLVRASTLNIDRMGSWSCKQMLYKLHKLVPQPSRHYYPLENIRIIFHQSSSNADLSSLLHQQLSSRLESAFYLQNKTLSSSPLTKKLSCHQYKVHHTWTVKGPDASLCVIFNYFTKD